MCVELSKKLPMHPSMHSNDLAQKWQEYLSEYFRAQYYKFTITLFIKQKQHIA
jgi:hypothetical protein